MAARAEAANQARAVGALTPRAQVARVLVGASMALALGAGPAIAWDLSTQAPHAGPARPPDRGSPWKAAGKQMKAAAGGLARIYLPRSIEPPVASENPPAAIPPPVPPSAPSATASAAAAAAAVVSPWGIEIE